MQESAQRLPLYHEGVPRDYPQREYRAASTDAGCCEHHTRKWTRPYAALAVPYSFHKTPENISYLQKVLEAIPFEKAVEMRHPAWFDEDLVRISQDFGFVPYR